MKALLNRVLNLFRRPADPGRSLSARFDAAVLSQSTARHWANADNLSADAAASPAVRAILRTRSRYEIANNPTAYGMATKLANDLIGTGPRLQMLLPDEADNDYLEQEWEAWATEIDLAEKLRTARIAKFVDGEAFILLTTNRRLPTPVKLDIRLIEADRVTNPSPTMEANDADGILLDANGNPIAYTILNQHPGDTRIINTGATTIPARNVIHLFKPLRPEQHRGIPELTPSLPIFALLRDWLIATVDAAKAAAAIAGVLYTDAPPGGEAAELDALFPIRLERNALLTMPEGWKMEQVEARHPSGNFAESYTAIEKKAIRATAIPWNVAASDSSAYNYASGRLDHQTYYRAIAIERAELERKVLRRLLHAWLSEAALIPGYLPTGHGPPVTWRYQWFWDGQDHVDPTKEASAQAIRLANGTTTLAAEYAKQGKDWRIEMIQRAKEIQLARELGLIPETTSGLPENAPPTDPTDDD